MDLEGLASEHLTLLASVSGIAGVLVEESGFISNDNYINLALGAGIALVGYFTKMDGISDAIEAFGIGYLAPAVLKIAGLGL
jgi:hypothetical protein